MANALFRYLTDDQREIILISILVMTIIAAAVGSVTVYTLHKAGIKSQENRLIEYVESQARTVEAIIAFSSGLNHPLGADGAAIVQVIETHESFREFGNTGEFSMAKREGGMIVFVLRHQNFEIKKPKPVSFDSPTSKAMREALSGRSGVITTLDHNGVSVLAAYEPVSGGHFGVVAKIDISEARAPTINAAILAAAVTVLLIFIGALIMIRSNAPLLSRLHDSETRRRLILDNVADGIVTINTDFKIQTFNEAARNIFGYSRKEVHGKM